MLGRKMKGPAPLARPLAPHGMRPRQRSLNAAAVDESVGRSNYWTERPSYMWCGRRGIVTRCESSSAGRTSVVPDVCVLVMSRANVGSDRACVTASNPDATLIGVASLKRVPINLIDTVIRSALLAGA